MRFLLTGTYNSGNKGDAAMEISAAQQIAEHFPGSEVTILSPFPEMDRPFYAPVPVSKCNRRQLISATFDLGRAMLWRIFGGEWLLSPVMKLVRDADLIIDLSGDMLTEDYGPHVAYSHYIPILRAVILKRPYFLCAQSIGPFKLTLPLARYILNKANAITPRDQITLDYLKKIGIRNEQVEQTADLAFLLSPVNQDRVEEILQAEGINFDDRPILGISLSQLIEDKYRSKNPTAQSQDLTTLMKVVIEKAARKFNAQVLFLAHVTGPSPHKNDRLISKRVREALSNDIKAHVLEGDYRPDELKGIISMCNVFCGARMHANIAALSNYVPTVAIAYSHKAPGIMNACGVGNLVAPVESTTEQSLYKLVERAFEERDVLSKDLERHISTVRTSAMVNVQIAERIVMSQLGD